jgi:hypothetical protein
LENEKSKPSADTLSALDRNTNINIRWLLTGEGEMKRQQPGSLLILNRTEEAVIRTLRFLGPDYAQDVYFSLRKQAQREARERKLKGSDLEDLESALDVLGKAAIE